VTWSQENPLKKPGRLGLITIVKKVRALISAGDVRISEHGYDELVEDGLSAREVLGGVLEAMLVEEYPDFAKGPYVLFLRICLALCMWHGDWLFRDPLVPKNEMF